MSYIDKINRDGTDYDIQDSKAARSVEGTTASHVLQANEIYTATTQTQFEEFIFRTTGGDASLETGNAIIEVIFGGISKDTSIPHVPESTAVTSSFASEETTVEINKDTWRGKVTESGDYQFSYNGSNWQLDGSNVTLSQYGLTVTGTVASGDTIDVAYTRLSTGALTVATPTSFVSTGFNQYDATAGYAHVVGGNQYRIAGTYTSLTFSETPTGSTSAVTVTDNRFIPEEDGYIHVVGGSGNILIALVWSGIMDDEPYSAYEESTITVPTKDAENNNLPTATYGLPGIGNIRDGISFTDKVYTQRIARLPYTIANLEMLEGAGAEYGVTMIYDASYIYYALQQPVVYQLAESTTDIYTANDFGTEEFRGTTVPIYTGLRYGNSLVDKLRNLVDIQEVGDGLEMDGSTIKTAHELNDDVPTGFFSGEAQVSGEGTNIELDGTMSVPLKEIVFNGNTVQTGTPSPDNPAPIQTVTGAQEVVVKGRNLCDSFVNSTNTDAGCTLTLKDGVFSVVGTANLGAPKTRTYDMWGWNRLHYVANYPSYAPIKDYNSIELEPGTYTLSVRVRNRSAHAVIPSLYLRLGALDTTSNTGAGLYFRGTAQPFQQVTFNVTNGQRVALFFGYATDDAADNFVDFEMYDIQIEKGSSFTVYDRPTQRFSLYLGEQLFNTTTTEPGLLDESGVIYGGSSSEYWTSDYIEINPYIKIHKTTTGSPRVKLYDSEKNVISTAQYDDITDFNLAGDFDVPYANAKYLRFTSNLTNKFAAHIQQPNIELNKVVFSNNNRSINTKESIYKEGDKWYLFKNTVHKYLDGSEWWTLYNNRQHTFSITMPHIIDWAVSNRFVNIGSGELDIKTGIYPWFTGSLLVSYLDMEDLATFKTWLSTHVLDVICLYRRDATVTEITDTVLLPKLNAIAAAMGCDDKTTISITSSDNLVAPLTVTAMRKTARGLAEISATTD